MVLQDLKDEEHDRKVQKGELKEDFIFRQPDMNCPIPCDIDERARICRACGKRTGPTQLTQRARLLMQMIEGGCPFDRDELSIRDWMAIGLLRMRSRVF
jgi:hypothetical protein